MFEESLIESGGESEIEEDPEFTLPFSDDEYACNEDATEQPHLPTVTRTR